MVTDFNGFSGDRVQLDPGVAYTVSQVGVDAVVLVTSSGDSITLQGVSAGSLPAGAIFLA